MVCRSCGGSIDAPGDGLARTLECARCGALVKTPETADTKPASIGCRLDFAEFLLLLRSAEPGVLNAAAFRAADLIFSRDAQGPRVRRIDGGQVSLEAAHVLIQQNATAQRGLYDLGMTLWR